MKIIKFIPFLCFMAFLIGCQEDDSTFDNQVYIKKVEKVGQILLKGDINAMQEKIQIAVPQPAKSVVKVEVKADNSLLSTYNQAYYDEAVILPKENYQLSNTNVEIAVGNVLSPEINIDFIDLKALDRETIYVLPVTIAKADISILQSDKTLYYVIKGASLINVVANIAENYCTINWKDASVCNNLSQMTMEALIRVQDYDRMISTVMGIEGRFLIRLGDANFPANQIQVATRYGNFPAADSNLGLPTNEWVHIALTYDSNDGSLKLFVNGSLQSETTKNLGSVSLGASGTGGFCIGRSYSDDRYLSGDISEVRIWNIVRTPEQIAANPYYVDPTTEGLVAYWKFNDESAKEIKDHTSNGNNAVANKTLLWKPVELPVPSE